MSDNDGEMIPTPFHAGSSWRRELPLALVLGGIVLWLWPVVFGQSTLFYRDLYVTYAGTSRVLAGEMPGRTSLLWDPYLNGGQPLLANPNRFVLYPSRLVYALTGAVTGLNLEILLHFLLGACGMYLLVRRIRPGPWAAALASIAWTLGGVSISLTNNVGRFFAFHWMPWAALAVELMVRGRRRNLWWTALTVILALQWLSGGFEVVLVTAVLTVGWAAVRGDGPGRVRTWGRSVAAVVIAPFLAGAAVIPAAAMALRSGRAGQQAIASILDWSVHPLRLVGLVMPGVFGPIDVAEVTGRYWGERLVDGGIPYFPSLYLGVSVVLLAIAGLRVKSGDRKLARVLAAFAGLGVVLSLGRYLPGVRWLVTTFHALFMIRYPVKATIMTSMPVALLAGFGAQRLLDATQSTARRWIAVQAGLAAVPATGWLIMTLAPRASGQLLSLYFGEQVPGMTAGVARSCAHVALVLAALALIAAVRPRRWRGPMVAILAAADLGLAVTPYLPRGPRWLLASVPPVVRQVQAAAGSGRFFRGPDPVPVPLHVEADRAWAAAAAHLSMLDRYLGAGYGIPMIYHPDDPHLANARYAALAGRVARMPLRQMRGVLELANVSAILAPGPLAVSWLQDPAVLHSRAAIELELARTGFPHAPAWFVPEAAHVRSAGAGAGAVCRESFDPRKRVFLEPAPAWPHLGFGPQTRIGTFEVDAPGRGWAVISIPWVPGMEARVDGVRRELSLADGPFMALPLDAGRHRLVIVYRPPEVAAGIAVSVLSFLCVIATACVRRRPDRSGESG